MYIQFSRFFTYRFCLLSPMIIHFLIIVFIIYISFHVKDPIFQMPIWILFSWTNVFTLICPSNEGTCVQTSLHLSSHIGNALTNPSLLFIAFGAWYSMSLRKDAPKCIYHRSIRNKFTKFRLALKLPQPFSAVNRR